MSTVPLLPTLFAPQPAAPRRTRRTVTLPRTADLLLRIVLSALTVVACAFLLRWEMALAFVATLAAHEYGHRLGLKRCGLPRRAVTLVPFVSCLLTSHGTPRTRGEETLVCAMGPTLAFALLPVIFGFGVATDGVAFGAALTTLCALYNLLALMPVVPLDGGRIVKAVSFSVHPWLGRIVLCLGPVVAVAVALLAQQIWIAAIIPFALFEIVRDLRDPPYGMRAGGRAMAIAWWALLVAAYGAVAVALAFVPGIDAAAGQLFRI